MLKTEIVTLYDVHMALADKAAKSTAAFNKYRFHADTYDKVDAALVHIAANHNPDIIMVGGDNAENEATAPPHATCVAEVQTNLAALDGKITTAFPSARVYYVLGNWDLYFCDLSEFVSQVSYSTIDHDGGSGDGVGAKRYYSFDYGGVHFIVLDVNYDETNDCHYDGHTVVPAGYRERYLGADQKTWLQTDLTNHASMPSIVFMHATAVMNTTQFNAHYDWTFGAPHAGNTGFAACQEADAIRAIFEGYGNVVLVCSGHYHPGITDWSRNKIKYAGFRGIILGEDDSEDGETNNSYGIITVKTGAGGDARVDGEYEETTNITYRNKVII